MSKKTFETYLFEKVESDGFASVLADLTRLLGNPNTPVRDGDIEAATVLRDQLREVVRSKNVRNSLSLFEKKEF